MDVETGIRNRLAELVDQHTQAVIAREGGVPSSSVYRYLRGRRIPAEFCAKLCRSLGINILWLLYDSGKATETEGAVQAGELAGKLTGMVASLLAVEKETSNVLPVDIAAGRFRRLQELLSKTEAARDQVQLAVTPIAVQLGQQLRTYASKGNLIRCADIEKALLYLLQLGLADDVRTEVELSLSVFASQEGRYEDSVRLREAVVWRYLGSADREPVELVRRVSPLVSALYAVGDIHEALALADAVLAGVRVYTGDHHCLLRLRAIRGAVLADAGNIREGLAEIVDILPRLDRGVRLIHYALFQKVQVMAGALTIEDAYRVAPDSWSRQRATELSRLAIWTEDKDTLELCLERIAEFGAGSNMAIRPVMTLYARCMYDLLTRKTKAPLKRWQAAIENSPKAERWNSLHRLREVKLLRLLGDMKAARRKYRLIDKDMQDGRTPPPTTMLNAADMIREAARLNVTPSTAWSPLSPAEWQSQHVQKGYHLFRNW